MSLKKGTKDVSLLTKIPPNVEPKTITTNGTYVASDEGLDGYNQVEVATSGVDINEYMSDTINSGVSGAGGWTKTIKKLRSPLTIEGTNAQYMFYGYPLNEIPQIDTSNVTNMVAMFSGCSNLQTMLKINTSKVTNMIAMFRECSKLTEIPLLDTSNVTDMSQMVYECSSLTTIPQLDTSKVTDMSNMFRGCKKLSNIPLLDTSNVTNMTFMFYDCTNLTTIPQLNGGKLTNISYAFSSCKNITDFNGITNLGQAYSTSQSANKYNYKLNLSSSTLLTEQSIINILNNLYDIATKGVKPQTVTLGSINLAKLTSTEGQQALQTAQLRGWNIN